jgi:mono/diheme cytochrome c family protein
VTPARLLVLAAVAYVSAACSGASQEEPPLQASETIAVDPRAEALARGRSLYEAHCASCHGTGALGDGIAAAGLPVEPANILEHLGDHSYEDMVRMVGEGIPPAMPAPPIGTEEVRLVLNYVWTLVPEADRPRLRALQEQAAEEH